MARDYTILHAPRISAAKFAEILKANRSPARHEAVDCYAAAVRHGVDPAVLLAVFRKESTFGRFGAANSRKSWGNVRRSPDYPTVGGFAKYPTWTDGAADASRLLAIYGRNQIRPGRNTSTVQTFPYVWAPTGDGNAPDKYGDTLARWIYQWTSDPGTTAPADPKVPSSGSGSSSPSSSGSGRTVAVISPSSTAMSVPCRPVFITTFKRPPGDVITQWYADQWVNYLTEQRGTGGFGLIPLMGATGEDMTPIIERTAAALSASIAPFVTKRSSYGQLPEALSVALPDKLADNSVDYVVRGVQAAVNNGIALLAIVAIIVLSLWLLAGRPSPTLAVPLPLP